jgi:hypothetical protein
MKYYMHIGPTYVHYLHMDAHRLHLQTYFIIRICTHTHMLVQLLFNVKGLCQFTLK